ncbi:uncharacterized protein L199_008357 [Kwoniella botswanensis]|uniref:uncharacterized protein n=1 Tax=Kwoniella botswanensis TaxID=1268659 RepID=UPI00315CFEEF
MSTLRPNSQSQPSGEDRDFLSNFLSDMTKQGLSSLHSPQSVPVCDVSHDGHRVALVKLEDTKVYIQGLKFDQKERPFTDDMKTVERRVLRSIQVPIASRRAQWSVKRSSEPRKHPECDGYYNYKIEMSWKDIDDDDWNRYLNQAALSPISLPPDRPETYTASASTIDVPHLI